MIKFPCHTQEVDLLYMLWKCENVANAEVYMNGKGERAILGDIKRSMHFYMRGFIMHIGGFSQFWLSHFGPKLVVGNGRILLICV